MRSRPRFAVLAEGTFALNLTSPPSETSGGCEREFGSAPFGSIQYQKTRENTRGPALLEYL